MSWGDWKHFVQYVGILNWFVPRALIPALAVLETTIETVLGIALLVGVWQRVVAWCSAGLLLSFALTMSLALGIVAPLSYSVFTAFGAALLLGAVARPQASKSRSAVSPMAQKKEDYLSTTRQQADLLIRPSVGCTSLRPVLLQLA